MNHLLSVVNSRGMNLDMCEEHYDTMNHNKLEIESVM
jgi:hypothetical protein